MKIAIVGPGSVGSALGERLTAGGYEVTFGIRPGRDIAELLDRCQGRARASTIREACTESDIVFLAVAVEALKDHGVGRELDGKILVDCNNPVTFDDGVAWAPPPEGSTTAQLAAAFPKARVIKGFATFGFALHRDPRLAGASSKSQAADVHLAGDDDDAKNQVAEIAQRAGFRPIDCGPTRNAAALENLAVLWIHLGMTGEFGREFGFQIVGRE